MKRIYLIIMLAAITLSGMAQTIGEAFYIYRNDGGFNAFFRDEVISIEYSYEDAEGNKYDEIVTQIVNTADSVYKIPLAAIDSIGFVQPETKYTNNVVRMEPLLPYIVSVDGLIVTFSFNMPSNLMPRVGDVLLQDNFDSDKLPDGFAGKVIERNGQQVVCESVSFEDIYEQIVCYGSYTAIDDAANNSMRLVPHRVGAGISTAIDINGTVGSTGTGVYGTVNGQLGLDLRVIFNFKADKPAYFDLSLTPRLSLTLTAGVKGQFSDNALSKKMNLLALPIPDTPFLLKLKAGPVLKYSVNASVTITTETSLGYKFGVKYEDGEFKGYGENISKWFSPPTVTGSISGSVFGGLQTEFGIFSYGDLLSLSLVKEAGGEFVANLTEGLLNSDKYEELQNAHFDLNLKASVGVSAKAKFFKWLSAEANWQLLSGQLNINSWKLVPAFQKPTVTIDNPTRATISVVPSEKLLFPVSIGLGVWDNNGEHFDTHYCPNTYRVFEDWGNTEYKTPFTGLKSNQEYTVYPIVKLLGLEIKASPSENFKMKGFPVTLSDFKVTSSQYKKNGFSHERVNYNYCFDVTVTATLDDDAEGISDWGYVYLDPNGKEAFISLKEFGHTYTDTRWAYYRNEAKSTCTLYGYVKYVGSDEAVYGEPHDYPLEYSETCCPDANHPHWIDLGLPSGTLWRCCNVGASTPEDYGNYYTFELATSAPSMDQIREFLTNTTKELTTLNGVDGSKYTGSNGASIFLPTVPPEDGVGIGGFYWSSTPSDMYNAHYFNSYLGIEGSWRRSSRYSVRPVR